MKHSRSLFKALSWRAFGTAGTVLLSWIFTGSLDVSLGIGSVDFFTKILLYYLHERIWLALPWARGIVKSEEHSVQIERPCRSIAKGVSWRITGTFDTVVVAFVFTGDYSKAMNIGATEFITKVFFYYIHERLWQRIPLGFVRSDDVQDGGGI